MENTFPSLIRTFILFIIQNMCSNYIVKEIELTDISSLVVLEGLFDSLYRDPKILYIDEFIINVHFSNEKKFIGWYKHHKKI